MLSHSRLQEALHYDPDIGTFTWRIGSRTGSVALAKRPDGYARVRLDGTLYYAHRLAFFYMAARWPTAVIDHINGNPSDNRWVNLREATVSQNHANKRSLNGLKGVSASRSRWRATIQVNGRTKHLGVFDTPEAAHEAYAEAAHAHFGQFARLT